MAPGFFEACAGELACYVYRADEALSEPDARGPIVAEVVEGPEWDYHDTYTNTVWYQTFASVEEAFVWCNDLVANEALRVNPTITAW